MVTKKIISIIMFLSLVSGANVFAKESKAIKGLDVSASAKFSSNLVWRGKSWSSNTPYAFVSATLDYSGAYFFIDQYSGASQGLGLALNAGYYNSIGSYKYDVGYINYGWMNDASSKLSYEGWDELYLKNSYKIQDNLSTYLYLSQRFLGINISTIEVNLSYTFNKALNISLTGGSGIKIQEASIYRNYAQLNLSHPCMVTGGTWGVVYGASSDTAGVVYGVSHSLSL